MGALFILPGLVFILTLQPGKMNLKKLFHIINAEAGSTAVQPVLALSVSQRYFCFSISNAQGNQLSQLAFYSADEINPETLAEILSLHPEASASFYKVAVCYHYPKHVLVPNEFYNHENIGDLWKSVHGVAVVKNIISEYAAEWQLHTVYAVPADVQQFLSRRYPTAGFKHYSTLALKNLALDGQAAVLKIDFGVDEFELVAVKQNKLLLIERFEYSTPNDIIYQLLKICNEYSLSQYETHLSVSGLVDKDSALYKEMYSYFIKIDFNNATWNHADYPTHFFTVLNEIAKCAS
jgi:hypothetical protein